MCLGVCAHTRALFRSHGKCKSGEKLSVASHAVQLDLVRICHTVIVCENNKVRYCHRWMPRMFKWHRISNSIFCSYYRSWISVITFVITLTKRNREEGTNCATPNGQCLNIAIKPRSIFCMVVSPLGFSLSTSPLQTQETYLLFPSPVKTWSDR